MVGYRRGNHSQTLERDLPPASQTVDEGGSASYSVAVSPAADRGLSIPVSISRGTAESGDYSPTSRKVSFASGDTSKAFSISTINDSDRDDETVNIRFSSLPAAVGTGTQSSASLTINDTTPARCSPTNTNSGGGGGGGGSSSKSNSGGGGGGGGGYSNYQRSSNSPVYVPPPSNLAPSFIEGDETHRSIVENSAPR